MIRFIFQSCLVAMLVGLAIGAGAWTSPANITALPDYECAPDVACDSLGNVHVVWFGGPTDNWRIYHRMRSPAGSWGGVTEISGSGAFTTHCAVDSANNLHVVWQDDDDREIYYRKRSPSGIWGAVTRVSNTPNVRSIYPDVACDGLGQVFVVWHEDMNDGSGNWELYMARFDGASWLPPERITNDAGISCYCAVACDAGNNLHVAWSHDYSEIYYRTRSNAGVWTPAVNISHNSGNSRDPHIAVSTAGVPHVVWHDTSSGNWDIYYATKIGGAWVGPYNLSSNPSATDCYAHVACSNDGSVNVIWHDYDNLYFARNAGTGFGLPIIVCSSGEAKDNAIAVDPGWDIHIVWQDKSPGSWDVFYMSNDYPDTTPPDQVSDFHAYGADTRVYLDWRNPSNLDFKGTVIRAKTSGYPASPTDGVLVCDRVAARGSTDSVVHSGLMNGLTYYYSAFTYDLEGNFSTGVQISATPQKMTCAYVKQLADSSLVDLSGKIVTAVFGSDSCIYIEEADRSSGIRVATTQTGLAVGDIVNVSGSMDTRKPDGVNAAERQVVATSIVKAGSGTPLEPISMVTRDIGGEGIPPYVPGVLGGIGLNNVGLLVQVAGRVSYKVTSYIYVDDGWKVPDISGRYGVMVRCPSSTIPVEKGDMVKVTGIVEGSIPSGWTTNRRYLHIRDWNDLMKVN